MQTQNLNVVGFRNCLHWSSPKMSIRRRALERSGPWRRSACHELRRRFKGLFKFKFGREDGRGRAGGGGGGGGQWARVSSLSSNDLEIERLHFGPRHGGGRRHSYPRSPLFANPQGPEPNSIGSRTSSRKTLQKLTIQNSLHFSP